MRSNLTLLLLIFSFVTVFSQPANKLVINLPNTGVIEDVKQIGPNRILMTFSVYACIVDSMSNIISVRDITHGAPTGNPRVGTARVKDGVILGYTNPSYTGVAFYKFKPDFSSYICGMDYNFGQPSGISNTWDYRSYIEDTTTKIATFVGGHSNCSEAIIVKFDSVLNVIYARNLAYMGGSGKYVSFDYNPTSLYLLHNDVGIGVPYIVRTNYSLSVQKAFYISLSDSMTTANKIKRTSDNKLLVAGRTYYKGQPNPIYFLMKCDSTGTNVSWCKTYPAVGNYLNFTFTLNEMNGKYYAGGETATTGVILEIDPNTGAMLNYVSQFREVVSITKFGGRQITATNDWAIPTFYNSNSPMNIASSCLAATYSISTVPLTYTITQIPTNQFITTTPWTAGGPPFNPANNPVTTSIISSCLTTGINANGINANDQISVYPNPFSGKLTVSTSEEKQNVQIFNALGALVHTATLENEKAEIDLSAQASGIYFVKVGEVTKKIVKE